MRKVLVRELEKLAGRPDFCFLTGDLGFMVLEPLRQILGERFINAGIAEQNMLSVAAGLAKQGLRPWVYSIAPFCYARPFEQIRNDIALHDLPVRILGNGAGYGYGVQGPTHHALEDCSVMRTLQNMEVFAPAFGNDLDGLINRLADSPHPAYVRLGYDFLPKDVTPPQFANFRTLLAGEHGVVFALGSMAGWIFPVLSAMQVGERPALCACCTFPKSLAELPEEILEMLRASSAVLVVEEQVAPGGLGECLAALLCRGGLAPSKFLSRHALGYPGKRYGSQHYYWKKSGLDQESLKTLILHEMTVGGK